MRKTKPFVKTCIMKAVGIDMNAKEVNIDFETFLQITKMLTPRCPDRQAQIQFCVRLFDPKLTGFIPVDEFEYMVQQFYEGDNNNGTEKENSFSEGMLAALQKNGLYEKGSYLNC